MNASAEMATTLATGLILAIGLLGGLWLGVSGMLVLCDNTPRSTIGHLRTLAGGMLALCVGTWWVTYLLCVGAWWVAFLLGVVGERL